MRFSSIDIVYRSAVNFPHCIRQININTRSGRMSQVQKETPVNPVDKVKDEDYTRIKNQTTTLRHAPDLAGCCSAVGLAATTVTWYRISACSFHNVTVALIVAPNLAIAHIVTKYAYKHDVTLPITAGTLSGDQAIALSTAEQLVFGSVIPVITASYPFLASTWEKGKKSGVTLSKHVGMQMKNFFVQFGIRGSRRHYGIMGMNLILQLGIGALLGYNQLAERNLVKDKIYKDNEILPEYQDLFLKKTDFSQFKDSFKSVIDRIKLGFKMLFPPAE